MHRRAAACQRGKNQTVDLRVKRLLRQDDDGAGKKKLEHIVLPCGELVSTVGSVLSGLCADIAQRTRVGVRVQLN